MSPDNGAVGRRDFLKTASAAGLSLGIAGSALAGRGVKMSNRVIGANDRINIGVIGLGGRTMRGPSNGSAKRTIPVRSWPSAISTRSASA